MDISGEWRQSADDQPTYSQPGFDDSAWRRVHLPWIERPAPGVLWLRRVIDIPAWADASKLALTLGSVAEGYEVYGNGVKFGTAAGLTLDQMEIARPRTFPMPGGIVQAGGQLVIAVHYRRIGYPGNTSLLNFVQGPYLLTHVNNAPKDAGAAVLTERWAGRSSDHVLSGIQFTMAALLLFFWFTERKRTELLFLAGYLISEALYSTFVLHQMYPDSHPYRSESIVLFQALTLASVVLLVEFAMATSGIYRRGLRIASGLVAGVAVVAIAIWQTRATGSRIELPYFILNTFAAGVTVAGCIRTARLRGAIEQYLLPLLLFLVISLGFLRSGRGSGLTRFRVGHYHWSSHLAALVILAFLMAVILLRRLVADRREKDRLTSELEAARVIQNLLLREPELEAAHLEAVYLPAQEVGGDFYYVLDRETLVIGDVSGKGLKAAMIVSLLIGVLRGTRERAPAAVLGCLNLALAEQLEGGFVTCCCARFEADGLVTIANAGHLLPWLDGVDVSAETGLPLGIALEMTWPETRLTVGLGQSMTFVSDGVVEAANAKREMFGFERTAGISGKPASEIAGAAKLWGQDDDITVVTVQRAIHREAAA